jgi:N-dimethylarginine dimethylaminohydrolase
MRDFGSQSMIAPLRRVLVKRPDGAFAVSDPHRWHYAAAPDLEIAQQEHDTLVALLQEADVEVSVHPEPQPDRADAIYVYDPALVTDAGAILLRMAKELRRGEEAAMGRRFAEMHIPVIGALQGDARAEGGDLLWLDHNTLAVGLGFRTNADGLRQLQTILEGIGVSVLPVEMPYHTGPHACLHLLSLISIVAPRLAVVYPPLLSVPFWQYLEGRDWQFITVPASEFETMGTNVLALAPGECLMLEGNPSTQRELEAAGCTVLTYRGNEISLKAEGGPTCLTRPILRDYADSEQSDPRV